MSSSMAEVCSGAARAGSALEVLLAACDATSIDAKAGVRGDVGGDVDVDTVPLRGALFLVIDDPTELTEPTVLVGALARGQRIVVAAAPGTALTLGGTTISVSARPIDTCSAIDPLVAAAQIEAVVATGPHAGAVLTTRDLAVVAGGRPIAHADGDLVVAATFDVGSGTVIVVGSERIGTDEFLAVGQTAEILAWMLTGGVVPVAEPLRRTMVGPEIDVHATPSIVTTATDRFDLSLLPVGSAVATAEFTRAAGCAGRLLPAAIHDALVDFADHGDPSGALLLRGLPVGEIPPTPDRPAAPADKD
ncbi:MAG TPA: hypothetical protein VIT64_09085, partial [Ilumatobacteraceae bacterium]